MPLLHGKIISIMTKKEYYKQYYQKNKDKINGRQKELYEQSYRKKRIQNRKDNPLECHIEDKKGREKYKEKRSASFKKYYQNNKEYFRQYEKNKARVNIQYRLGKNMRARIWCAINRKWKKSKRTSEMVGCSLKYLKKYLESLFEVDMSWDNYGEWHIDHIIPCIKFDLKCENEVKKCFHYTNLQPLWQYDNLSKGSK